MLIYNGTKVVAYTKEKKINNSTRFYVADWAETYEAPYRMFGNKVRECGMKDFKAWADERVVPENQFGIEMVLEEAGLIQYDWFMMFKAVKGRNIGTDKIWIDFDADITDIHSEADRYTTEERAKPDIDEYTIDSNGELVKIN